MKRILAVSTLLATLAGSAQAQQNCGQRQVVIDYLAEKFGESRQSIGMAQDSRVIEVFASLETGSWTITVTLPNGMTCLVASGTAYEHLAEVARPSGVQG